MQVYYKQCLFAHLEMDSIKTFYDHVFAVTQNSGFCFHKQHCATDKAPAMQPRDFIPVTGAKSHDISGRAGSTIPETKMPFIKFKHRIIEENRDLFYSF